VRPALLERGYDEADPGMNATGYIELIPYHRGRAVLDEAVEPVRSHAAVRAAAASHGSAPAAAGRILAGRDAAGEQVSTDIITSVEGGEPVKIGISCYPVYGGSGVVATELGIELAARGHEVHFITYAQPFRLPYFVERVFYHEVEVPNYPLFEHPPYNLALSVAIQNVVEQHDLDLLHAHYAVPHATSAWIARELLGRDGLPHCHHAARHGHHAGRPGSQSFRSLTQFSIAKSDGLTAVSEYLRQETHTLRHPAGRHRGHPELRGPGQVQSRRVSVPPLQAGPNPARRSSRTSRTSGPSSGWTMWSGSLPASPRRCRPACCWWAMDRTVQRRRT
jgi:hypothetical protein